MWMRSDGKEIQKKKKKKKEKKKKKGGQHTAICLQLD